MTLMVSGQSAAYCGPPARPDGLWSAWNGDPWLIAALLVLAVAGGVLAVRRGAEAGLRNPALLGAWLLAFALFVTPLCAMAVALFSVRAVSHLLLVAVLAPLLAYGLGGKRLTGGLTTASIVHAVIFWFWHAPSPYTAALSHDGVYWLMQLTLLTSGVWFWRALMARRSDIAASAGTLAGFAAQMGLLGALIGFAPDPLYAPHAVTTAAWGLTALEDQQLAGLIMWVPGVLPYLIALGLAVTAALGEGERGRAK
ncbi:cytochrome c oxidase assembly protein [Glycocaulis sp.]|uniref:cytochrome c oxidase assembly protein n=1 Tax=Glycocaulis sp. TaxID=1969725 RepID=UPI003D1E8CA4